jgi:hypothetical protein
MSRKNYDPNRVIDPEDVLEHLRAGLTLEEIGTFFGNVTRQNISGIINQEVVGDLITQEEYIHILRQNHQQRKHKNRGPRIDHYTGFVDDLVAGIFDLNQRTYNEIKKRHGITNSPKISQAIKLVIEDAIEDEWGLEVDVDFAYEFIKTFSKRRLSLSQLYEFTTDYTTNRLTLDQVARRHGLTSPEAINGAASATLQIRHAIAWGFISREDYVKQAKGNLCPPKNQSSMSRKYSNKFVIQLYQETESGATCIELEEKYDLPQNTASKLICRARREKVIK